MQILKINGITLGVLATILSVCIFSEKAVSQDNDIDFVIERIRKDYFPLVPESDIEGFEKFIKLKKKKGVTDTLRFISEVADYFKDQHLICYQRKTNALDNNELPVITIPEIKVKVKQGIHKKDMYAGYWINDLGTEVIGIFKFKSAGNKYLGYVISSTDTSRIGKLTLRFSTPLQKNALCEFINVYFQYRQFAPIQFVSANEIQIWSYTRWKRIKGSEPGKKHLVKPYSYQASVSIRDNGLIVFKIPENSPENIGLVDSLVLAHKKDLEKARYLIIDIRNNPGGTIRTYSKLLPYIYTNEIIRPDGHTYVSRDLIDYEIRNLNSIDSVNNRADFQDQKKLVDSLRSVEGQRVFYKGKNKKFDTVIPNPLKVGLLVNYASMSAAEAMVLDLRQSKKVVIFGENTAGAIDNLNTFFMRTPSGKYSIWMPTFRGIPTSLHRRFAGIGIQPDVRILSDERDWIQYVITYFETH